MALKIRKTTGVFLAAVGLAIATSAVTAGAASAAASTTSQTAALSAIGEVPCNNASYVHVIYHIQGEPVRSDHACFANAGKIPVTCCSPTLSGPECWPTTCWLDEIDTGNNRVQYHGNGQWLPSGGINKHTDYFFPHHPGGVTFDAISILP